MKDKELRRILRDFSARLNMATLFLAEALDSIECVRTVRGNDGVLLKIIEDRKKKPKS